MTTSQEAKAGITPVDRPAPREKAPSQLKRTTGLRRSSFGREGQRSSRERRQAREAIYTYACDIPGEVATCWLAQHSSEPCGGRMTKAHLISKQAIRKEIWNPALAEPNLDGFPSCLRHLQDDPRCWVPACWAHHQALDIARTLRIGREELPAAVEEFAAQYGVVWLRDREFGRPSIEPVRAVA